MVKVGERIPEITVEAVEKGEFTSLKLSDYRGKWTVLFFYSFDFSSVCSTEISAFSKKMQELSDLNTVVLGASADSVHSHKAWIEKEFPELSYPIIADPSHELSRLFGVLVEGKGFTYRGTFIIDPEGILRFASIGDIPIGRGVEETMRMLKALQSGKNCPADWTPGQQTLA